MLRVLFRLTISLLGAAVVLLPIITLLGYFFPDPTRAKWQPGQSAELAQAPMGQCRRKSQLAATPSAGGHSGDFEADNVTRGGHPECATIRRHS